MLFTKNKKSYIANFNFKDVIIIFSLWYVITLFSGIPLQINLENAPFLTGYFRLLILSVGRLVFLALTLLYFIHFYKADFGELGLGLKQLFKKFRSSFSLIIVLLLLLIVFINIPLSHSSNSQHFNPLYEITEMGGFLSSLGPLIIIIIPSFIIGLSEQFLLNNIVVEIFNYKLPTFISLILGSLFYSFILLHFLPQRILLNTLLGLITIYLYLRTERGLLLPSLFSASYYAFYICYIFGWSFLP